MNIFKINSLTFWRTIATIIRVKEFKKGDLTSIREINVTDTLT
jgi:hypothetical protein